MSEKVEDKYYLVIGIHRKGQTIFTYGNVIFLKRKWRMGFISLPI